MASMHPYIPIGVILVLAAGFGAVSLILGRLVGPRKPNPVKALPYESGMIPEGDANVRIPVKFYMVALLFLLFDIESVYILSWAVVFRGRQIAEGIEAGAPRFSEIAPLQFTRFAFLEMLVFIAILLVGYAYVWRKGGLKWS